MVEARKNGSSKEPNSEATKQMLLKVIELNPDMASAHANLGRWYAQRGAWQRAVECYQEAIRLQPDNSSVHRSLKRVQTQLKYKDSSYSKSVKQHQQPKTTKFQSSAGKTKSLQIENLENSNAQYTSSHFAIKLLQVTRGGVLKGWVVNLNDPEKTVWLRTFIDQQKIGQIEAKELNTDIILEGNLQPKSLVLYLPILNKEKFLLDGKKHQINFDFLDKDGQVLESAEIWFLLPNPGIGVVDSWENNYIQGWATPEENPTKPAILDMYVDGVFYSEIVANKYRGDLSKYSIGNDGHHGFDITIPQLPKLPNVEGHQVDIFFQGTNIHLRNSPIHINSDRGNNSFLKKNAVKSTFVYNYIKGQQRQIAIIVPIYNAYEQLYKCFNSIIKNTLKLKAKLILINDASTDNRIDSLLQWAKEYSNVEVIKNEINLGYTKTINKGIRLAENSDIVLLNSDTIVGPHWLQNLQIAAYHTPDIGTVTAISNNAGAFSVPEIARSNELPLWLQKEEVARLVSQNSQIVYPETPTANGFCMYICRDLINDIGEFDEQSFPRGYGEENDFCIRALRRGWRHIVDDQTFVFHVRSASFGAEKQSLYKQGRELIGRQYPEYKSLVFSFVNSPEMQLVRYNVRRLVENKPINIKQPLPRILYVIATQTGGTPQTNEDLMKGVKSYYHTMLLRCNAVEITLYDTSANEPVLCEKVKLQSPVQVANPWSSEYEKIVGEILVRYKIEVLHIRHIAWHSISLPKIASKLGIPVIFSFHDFYTICPNVNLLDENLVFCGGRCTNTDGECNIGIWSDQPWSDRRTIPKLKHHFVKVWQKQMNEVFNYVDAFVTTSNSTKCIMQGIYSNLKESVFWVIPHGRDFNHFQEEKNFSERIEAPSKDASLKLLFPGNIGDHKGARLIAKINELDINRKLDIHFLGHTRGYLKSIGIHHGTYKREDFQKLVKEIKPHYICIFSIWPETYCHTLTEAWASGIPVIAIDMGAVGERVRQYGGGWLIDSIEPKIIYEKLLEIANDREGYWQKVGEVQNWIRHHAKQNTINVMASQYNELYRQTQNHSQVFIKPNNCNQKDTIKVGGIVKENKNGYMPPTAHIRILEWMKHPSIKEKIFFQNIQLNTFLQDEDNFLDLDIILVQRNAIQQLHLVELFIKTCRKRNLPFIYEIDDDLINIPADKDYNQEYRNISSAIQLLVESATTVTVSTPTLANRLQLYNNNIVTIPNVLSEVTWLKPIEINQNYLDNYISKNKTSSRFFKVLYMGNSSHAEDLAIVRPVFEKLYQEGYSVQLFMIGGERKQKKEAKKEPVWYTRIEIPDPYYPNFVRWFRSIAPNFDLAIAPLADTEFNKCKSPLKFLQYSAAGLPSICSNYTPYKDIISNGINGFLVDNQPNSWYDIIIKCLNDRDKIQTVANYAYQLVINKYLMRNYIDKYYTLFWHTLLK